MRLSLPTIVSFVLASTHGAMAQASPEAIDGRTFYLPLVTREAALRGLPPEIADAVAMVETGYRPNAVGSSGEIGLMQVMPATAAQLGFRGTLDDLADPATNIQRGGAYLSRAGAAAGGDICRALTKYRAGLGEEVTSPLSAQYCARATAWLMGGRATLDHPGGPASAGAPWTFVAAPDPYVVAMPPIPEGVRLTPTFAMSHVTVPRGRPHRQAAHVAGSSNRRENSAETFAGSGD